MFLSPLITPSHRLIILRRAEVADLPSLALPMPARSLARTVTFPRSLRGGMERNDEGERTGRRLRETRLFELALSVHSVRSVVELRTSFQRKTSFLPRRPARLEEVPIESKAEAQHRRMGTNEGRESRERERAHAERSVSKGPPPEPNTTISKLGSWSLLPIRT